MATKEVAPEIEQDSSDVSQRGKVEVTETAFDSASDNVKSVNEKTGEVSVESPQDEDTEYVKGHPVIRNGAFTTFAYIFIILANVHCRPRCLQIHRFPARRWGSCVYVSVLCPRLRLHRAFKCHYDALCFQTLSDAGFFYFSAT